MLIAVTIMGGTVFGVGFPSGRTSDNLWRKIDASENTWTNDITALTTESNSSKMVNSKLIGPIKP
jgi:hypothetical protein